MKNLGWRYLGFVLAGLAWSLLVIWMGIILLLAVNLLLFDLIVTRRIDWTLRSYPVPRFLRSALEWAGILLLALITSLAIKILVVEAYKIPTPSMEETLLSGDFLFVSKLSYGPRLPQTPLALPFYHNKLPSGRKPYSERITLPHKRLAGISRVKRGDIIVFNFPEGDTMVVQYPGQNYYSLVRQYGREYILSEFDIITHPVDKRENFVKRCVGLPGDTLQIRESELWVNGRHIPPLPLQKFKYYVTTTGKPLPGSLFDSLKIRKSSVTYNPVNSLHVLFMTEKDMDALVRYPAVRSVKRFQEPMLSFQNQEIFPHNPDYRWTGDNFGPLPIPARGDTILLDHLNLPIYRRIIDVYEENSLQLKDGEILINGKPALYYTFKMNYYFVMGDNHHNSADSRYWGFVPEDHLLGKAVAVWFSIEPEKPVLDGFRKERIFRPIK